MDWLVRKLGREVRPEEVRDILERLAFGVSKPSPRTFSVTVPSWRATRDISVKDDLVEEVGRMIGYDSIQPKAPAVLAIPPPVDEERLYHRDVRSMMAAQGFTEVYNYSFVSPQQALAFCFNPADHVTVRNPIAADQVLMRRSLVPGIWSNICENRKHVDSFQIFEIGREIHKQPQGLPREIPRLAAAVYRKEGSAEGLFELKRAAECLMEEVEARPAHAKPYEHPARAAEMVWHGQPVGRLFELHPSLIEGRAAILDLDLQLMLKLRPKHTVYRPIRHYPSSSFDLSVIAGSRELAGDLQRKLTEFVGEPLEKITYIRQYAGPPLPEGAKSVSFRLTVGAKDRTLSSEEVGEIRTRIIERMREMGYELRV